MLSRRVSKALAVMVSAPSFAVLLCGCGGGTTAHRKPTNSASVARAAVITRPHFIRHRRLMPVGRRHPVARTPQTGGARATRRPLGGEVVGVDPGHNGANATDLTYIDHQIWNGREYENCNTTGTETDAGYAEARFNWNVATYLVADLRREGARVVLTRHSNDGVGPCVNRRAQIFNRAHVDVGVAIHADGGPPDGRGFAILEPVSDGINDRVIAPSHRFARILRARFLTGTGMPESTYDGGDGLKPRDDLAGENLTRVPYALIECGNMRNATDASLLISPRWQRRAAAAIATAVTGFVAPH